MANNVIKRTENDKGILKSERDLSYFHVIVFNSHINGEKKFLRVLLVSIIISQRNLINLRIVYPKDRTVHDRALRENKILDHWVDG